MKLPISFEEVSYFNNEYRGDLIVTNGVLYYFPHTRVAFSKYDEEIGGKETAQTIGLIGNLIPFFGMAPWIHTIADKSFKAGTFLRRTFRPTTNAPRIRQLHLWRGNESNSSLQEVLDAYISTKKKEPLEFDEDSVPKPIRFSAEEIENCRLGLKLKFDAKYDTHDFRVNLIHKNLFRSALKQAGFLP